MTLEQANHMRGRDRVRILAAGIARHGLDAAETAGTYVSQFESPKIGRIIVVRVPGAGSYGFSLDEVELHGQAGVC